MKRRALAAVIAAGFVLAGCGSNDEAGCNVIQDDYKAAVQLLDQWQDGDVPNREMLDALQELHDTASQQMTGGVTDAAQAAKSAANDMYRAVNTGSASQDDVSDFLIARTELDNACANITA